MSVKEITVVFYGRRPVEGGRGFDIDESVLAAFFAELNDELEPLGVHVLRKDEKDFLLDVKGYADLLNTVRIRAPRCGVGNPCLGHIIGASKNLDILEDIRRGVNRVAFAPEMIEPEGSDKVVCHNCGCGC